METVLQTKVDNLNEIVEAINRICENGICRFNATIVKDMFPTQNTSAKITARLHKSSSMLVLRIECTHVAPKEKNGVHFLSQEVCMSPDFIVIDESRDGQPRIDFYAVDLKDLPSSIPSEEYSFEHERSLHGMPNRRDKAIQQLTPKVYASIQCY
jgi:hypothetical protein